MNAVAPSQSNAAACRRVRVVVQGAVQGVGFRPFVYRHARALGLGGWVGNAGEGVLIEAEGAPGSIAALLQAIEEAPPPNAVVTSIETRDCSPCGDAIFAIRSSVVSGARTAEILPDLATCDDCLREMLDPADRRFLYPFINCVHCGPRFSIVEDIPYDRARTAMRHFPMCPACRAEYEDPLNRRFHAEPIACADCGPQLALWTAAGAVISTGHAALLAATAAVRRGAIVAVKGIGGFHLIADARDEDSVARLRRRKRREEKPVAVMFPSLAAIRETCRVAAVEEALLLGPARPIVLLRRCGGAIAPNVAPGIPWLGAMLPYAPLHHLLLHELGFPVVATSGNLSDEPIVTREAEVVARLGGIADLFLVNDRPIVRAVDDSVVRVVCGRELVLRRSRGYVPAPIPVAHMPAGILAAGGHLKATIALSRANQVCFSQHIGDLDTIEARSAYARAVADTIALHSTPARCVVRDLHPDYASSRAAEAFGVPVVAVQHHVAHIAACMAENGIVPPLLGVAWDGTGFGPDGTVWGGEFLLIGTDGWRRFARLRPFRLPGGDSAIREPRRAALGLLYEAKGASAFAMNDLPAVAAFTASELSVLRPMLDRGVNSPLSSSAGRLFDAFAALAGLRQFCAYEGQAAIELEGAADDRATERCYPFDVRRDGNGAPCLWIVDWAPALDAVLADIGTGAPLAEISAALHNGLAASIAAVAARAGERIVTLGGGCFQNARLTEAAVAALRAAGMEPVWHRRVPPNDGGLALGQAAWAARMDRSGEPPCA